MVGSGLEDEIGNWVPGNEADLSLGSLDFFNFPSVSLEGDGLDEGDWDAKLRDIELYTSDSFLDASDGEISNAASKLKQEPPSEFAEEAPRTRTSAHNGYSDGLNSRDNQAPSPDSVLNSNHSSSGEKGISKISEDLVPPQPYSSESHDSSAPRRSKRVASKPVYRSFNYPDFYIPETVACLGEEQPQKKKKRKLSKLSDTGKVPICSSEHTQCSCCDATETIEWREGPLGPKILCKSCGIQYRYGRLFPEYHPAARPTFDSSLQTMFSMKGSDQEEKKAVCESHLILDDEVPELETESKMSMSSDDFEFYPSESGIKGKSSKRKLNKRVKVTMQTSSHSGNQRCLHCDVGKTTQWREGPMGPRTLCNACGIRYRSGRLFPEYRPADSPTFVPSLHSFSHRKVIELRKKAMQEASLVLKEPNLSQPKLMEGTAVTTGTLLMSPSKDMKEEAIIPKELPLSQAKQIKEATNFDMEPPLQPLGAIVETVITDSKPQVLSCKDMKEAAMADSEPLLSLPNDTKEVSAEIAAPMSLPFKDMKETPFVGIEPPLVPSKVTEEVIKTDIELLSSPIKDTKEVAIVTKPVMSPPNATKEAAVAIREPPLRLKAIHEAVIVEPRPRISPIKAMEEVITADEETIPSAPEVEKHALAEINHSLSQHGGSESSFLNGKNSVKRIRKKDKEKKDQNKEKKKKLPKLSGIPGTNMKSLVKPAVTRKCLHCGINKSPLWREGPLGRKTLCNACGLRYASGRLFPEYRPAASPSFVPDLHSNSHKKVVQLRQEDAVATREVSTHYSMLFNSSNR